MVERLERIGEAVAGGHGGAGQGGGGRGSEGIWTNNGGGAKD